MNDFHVHERHSGDAKEATAKDYCLAAEARGIDEIGFATHLIIAGPETGYGISPELIPEYFKEIESAQASTRVKLRIGLEVDYFPDEVRLLDSLLDEYPYDFILGSIHYVSGYDIGARDRIRLHDISLRRAAAQATQWHELHRCHNHIISWNERHLSHTPLHTLAGHVGCFGAIHTRNPTPSRILANSLLRSEETQKGAMNEADQPPPSSSFFQWFRVLGSWNRLRSWLGWHDQQLVGKPSTRLNGASETGMWSKTLERARLKDGLSTLSDRSQADAFLRWSSPSSAEQYC